MPKIFKKDPGATLNYTWSLANWLATGDTLLSFTIDEPAGITLVSNSNDTTTITGVFSGGTEYVDYSIPCAFSTADGLIDERTITIKVRNR